MRGLRMRLAVVVFMAVLLAMWALPAFALPETEDRIISKDPFYNAVEVNVNDGLYLVDVTLDGGSGRAKVLTPTEFEVYNGVGAVTLEWSSPHYDYMLVGDRKYLPENDSGNSKFVIPVLAYDEPFKIVADTTAMSEPHEVEYQLTVDLVSVRAYVPEEIGSGNGISVPWVIFAVCMTLAVIIVSVTAGILWKYRESR